MTQRRFCDGTSIRWSAWGIALFGGVLGTLAACAIPLQAQDAGSLSGTWALDRDSSQFPREIGFNADFFGPPGGSRNSSGGGRGGRGGSGDTGGSNALESLRPRGESYDDAQRRQRLTDEVRTPPARLTIVDSPEAVTFTDDAGNARTLHPDGRAETLRLGATPVLAVARREDGKLLVLYAVADLRQIRYTYSRPPGTASLVVDVEFLERSKPGDTVRRVYNTFVPPTTTATAAAPAGSAQGPAPAGTVPAAPAVARAGSEFAGLKRLGLVVEELSAQAAACGLTRATLEAAVAKPFTEAGLKVSTNSDEDTYVDVMVMTSTLSNGLCVSRYDWSLYSMTGATLSYQRTSLLAQVLLAHKGGLAGSMPPGHGADVIRGISEGLVQIAGTIRDANK